MSDCIMKRSGSIEDEAATKRAKVEDTADTTSTQDKQAVDTNTTLDTKDISDQSSRAATTDKDTSLETPQIASDSVIVDGVEGGISTEHTDETPYEGKYFRDIRKESHMSEAMAGIEAFTTPGTPFHCILKHRYSDFVVNEIDPDGNVVHLTSLECHLDLEEQDKAQEKQQEDVKIAEQPADADFFDTLSGVLDAGWITKVKEYLTNSLNEDDIPNKEALRINTEDSSAAEFGARALVFPYEDSKDKRTRLHQFVKTHFATTHRTDTVANADKKTCVRIVKGRNQDKRRPRKTENKFLEFVLYKEARDTMSSVSIIGKTLNARPHIFSYAGVKDKRAITTQRMRIKGREAQNTFRANSRLTGMFLGNMKYADTPLGLGDLQGNRFTVVLRELSGIEDEDITTRIEDHQDKRAF
ncbi:hypothetical protein SARC_05352 [Sphaeroforma arctica JP610]|uniref:TRUD domain-containing protein n=1 Tax=Sphaeroforma arctica JP610 TaxID=667725 RepID=A0A0L0G0H4_9EUKA|nr:hypothetical protein SARC_05352 [Sphaeroforma arctica JP610]KNC82359.1 hypothetical protein SARC_05352 [Sphaeroforma arctica JP610]|eukprot:XP_014156261.1 hypothetical protein SARC_05352 [Sphaeroforma arctica JP610]